MTQPRTESAHDASDPRRDGVTRFVRVGATHLHLRSDAANGPETGPPLVHLHSLGTDHRIWDEVVVRIRGRRQIRIDLPGHGLSDPPREPCTIEGLAEVVTRLLDAEGVDRAVLVGLSLGGQIALRIALDAPERVAAFVGMDTGAKLGEHDDWNRRIDAVLRDGMLRAGDAIVARWFAPGFAERAPETEHGMRTRLARTPAGGYADCCRALRDEDLRPRLNDLRAPSLVLCGAEDRSTSPDRVRAFAAALPNARYQEIAGAGHQICVERPGAVADALSAFLTDPADPGAAGPALDPHQPMR